jgi:hypothetical protein
MEIKMRTFAIMTSALVLALSAAQAFAGPTPDYLGITNPASAYAAPVAADQTIVLPALKK